MKKPPTQGKSTPAARKQTLIAAFAMGVKWGSGILV